MKQLSSTRKNAAPVFIPNPGSRLFRSLLLPLKILSIGLLFLTSSCWSDIGASNLLSPADQEFLKKATYHNLATIDAGKLAGRQGDSVSKWYGDLMALEYQRANTELRLIATDQNVVIAGTYDSVYGKWKSETMLLSGRAFDSAYRFYQLKAHRDAVLLYQNEVKSGTNSNVTEYAKKYLPKLERHLQMADSIAGLL